MHKILPETEGDFVALEVSGKLEELDFEIMVPLLQARIEEFNTIALLVVMRDFHGWTAGALWADTKFDLKHHGDFSRIAIVGDQRWEEWMAILAKPFTSADVRFFGPDQRDVALRWASGQ